MRYVLTMEAIGDNYAYHRRQFLRSTKPFTRREIQYFQLGGKHLIPWVAKIVGIDSRCRFIREFVAAQKDYSKANSIGSRGIILMYFLEPGLYEINERLTWQKVRRYFARVMNHTTLVEMTREEILRCLP